MRSDSPIGIFDSGVGGLTVAKEVSARLPQEHIAYVGDEVHIPYGDRPPEQIRSYALGITRFLIDKCGAKMVIMACNMSSALALDPAREMFPGVPILGDLTSGTPDGRHLADWDSGGWDFGPGGICEDCLSDPQRIILLDLDGQPLVILVDSEKPEDQAAFVERAMPIIESLRFPE